MQFRLRAFLRGDVRDESDKPLDATRVVFDGISTHQDINRVFVLVPGFKFAAPGSSRFDGIHDFPAEEGILKFSLERVFPHFSEEVRKGFVLVIMRACRRGHADGVRRVLHRQRQGAQVFLQMFLFRDIIVDRDNFIGRKFVEMVFCPVGNPSVLI
ncbi:MAG: hypothetical protein BWY09_02757 [Candidatus Hydrogenedentes bacterium ADurb.Bin179]|nr:MAG: hypothetical protein BWY09_02757 [Candidatus Hydrogenedentes bacterium ADurb.Bin179]